jgi:isopentenyl-diphosphate delta-isomerase
MNPFIIERKNDHLRICLEKSVEYSHLKTGFEDYQFIPPALPEINRKEIDISTTFFQKSLRAPILISGMTGGTPEGKTINRNLARAAQDLGLAMGVGSQRIAFENDLLKETFQVRDIAPDIPLLANLGAIQLNYGFGVSQCREAIKMVGADGLALHLNPLHEALQLNGNTNFGQLREKIRRVSEKLGTPVIIKGVGTGISSSTAEALKDTNIYGIDVGGSGGTCWALVEYYRAKDPIQKNICKSFQNWGIPTAKAIQEIRKTWPNIFLIGSGGIRSGIDGAKSIALGADLFGMALPLLKPATQSASAVKDYLYQVIEELKLVMFSIGAQTLDSLKETSLRRVVE